LTIQPRRKRGPEVAQGTRSLGVALHLLRIVQVIHNDPIAALPRDGPTDGGRNHHATGGILKLALDVLILGEADAVAPAVLIPVGLEHRPPVQRVLERERLSMTRKDPATARRLDPFPR